MSPKSVRNRSSVAVTGVRRFFAIPLPSYGTHDIVELFSDTWPAKLTLQAIRRAVREGILRPFSVGSVARYTREDVGKFVARFYPARPTELVNAAISSGFAEALIPSTILLAALREAAAGQWRPEPEFELGRFDGSAAVGSRMADTFPAATRDHYAARIEPNGPDDRVPPRRERVRRNSRPRPRGTAEARRDGAERAR